MNEFEKVDGKTRKIKKSIKFFIKSTGLFDIAMENKAIEIIMYYANLMDFPTTTNLGEKLGITRNRMAGLLIDLGIKERQKHLLRTKRNNNKSKVH